MFPDLANGGTLTACRFQTVPSESKRFVPDSRRLATWNGSHFSKNLERCSMNMIVGSGRLPPQRRRIQSTLLPGVFERAMCSLRLAPSQSP